MALPQPTHLQVKPLPPWAEQERHQGAVEVLLDYTTLPHSGPIVARPDHVLVPVATVADLHRWLLALREYGVTGQVDISPAFHGLCMWVLHTHTPPGRGGHQTPLRVAALAPAADTTLPRDLTEAVAS